MSDLLMILDRLVKENLHGPIDPSTVSSTNGRQQPPQRQTERLTEDMDARDPR